MSATAWSRRDLLLGLSAVSLAGCPRRPGSTSPSEVPATLRLGWRWSPGLARAWRVTTVREAGAWTTSRTEAWRYLAVDVAPSGVVSLEATLLGVGGEARHGEEPEPAVTRAVKAVDDPVPIVLAMQVHGHLEACSAEGFAEGLPHRLLGLHLPAEPVPVGASWADPGLLRAFAEALPMDVPLRTEATTRLTDLVVADDTSGDTMQVTLRHRATLRTPGLGPGIALSGTTQWDPSTGSVLRRELLARFVGTEGPTLQITMDAIAVA